MEWWNVLDWVDQKTVRVVGTSGFQPFNCIGPAAMVNPVTPVPEAALTTQLVNGVVSVLVDQGVLSKLFPGLLGGLKLF